MRQADTLWTDETYYPRERISNWVWAAIAGGICDLSISGTVRDPGFHRRAVHGRGDLGSLRGLRVHRS